MKRMRRNVAKMSTARHRIHIQQATQEFPMPSARQLRTWAKLALSEQSKALELTLRLVDKIESAALNQQYRHKQGPTNVLSFPFELGTANYLGDIVICVPLVAEEATTQHKFWQAHWAHLVIHGVLHLLGYDHITAADAAIMEAYEIKLLASLDYPNPYHDYE